MQHLDGISLSEALLSFAPHDRLSVGNVSSQFSRSKASQMQIIAHRNPCPTIYTYMFRSDEEYQTELSCLNLLKILCVRLYLPPRRRTRKCRWHVAADETDT